MLDSIIPQLNNLTPEQLLELSDHIDNLITSKNSDSFYEHIFDSMRARLAEHFTFDQVASFKTWKYLTLPKRTQFQKAWRKAVKGFQKIDKRFLDNAALHDTLILMVAESPYFTGHLLFTDIIESLNQIDILFDHHFPHYRTIPGAIDALIKSLGNPL